MAAEKKRERKVVPEHMKEAQAMTRIGKALDGMPESATKRIVSWINSHYAGDES
jgi:hypothetical protein